MLCAMVEVAEVVILIKKGHVDRSSVGKAHGYFFSCLKVTFLFLFLFLTLVIYCKYIKVMYND